MPITRDLTPDEEIWLLKTYGYKFVNMFKDSSKIPIINSYEGVMCKMEDNLLTRRRIQEIKTNITKMNGDLSKL